MNKELENLLKALTIYADYTENNYFSDPRIGHSSLVDFEQNGPKCLRKSSHKLTQNMVFGSLVDTLLTTPYNFDSKFFIVNEESDINYTDNEKILFDGILSQFPRTFDFGNINDSTLIEIAKKYNFYSRYSPTKLLEKIKSLENKFYCYRQNSIGVYGITQQQYNNAIKCITTLKESPITSWIFNADRYIILFQNILMNNEIKCMHDIIVIDEKDHKIYQFDLKCVSYNEYDFINNSFYRFRYFREAEIYTYLLKEVLTKYNLNNLWSIEDFRFIVINQDSLSPMIYKFPIIYNADNQLQISKNNFVKHFYNIIEDIKWHYRNDQYNYPKDIYYKLCENTAIDKEDERLIIETDII